MPKETNKNKIWLTVAYQPVSLFSLKRSDATSMAARGNLIPTPYAIKMALLKVLIEREGDRHRNNFETWIEGEFKWIRDLEIRVRPCDRLVVNRNGYKLRYFNQQADKDYRKANDKQPPPVAPMQGGFVFREWVYAEGNLTFCCDAGDRAEGLAGLFALINYFGKRGCFFQYLPEAREIGETPTIAPVDPMQGFTVQPMDDLGIKATFDRINPFSDSKMGKSDRIVETGFLPLKLLSTGDRYDFYEREDRDTPS